MHDQPDPRPSEDERAPDHQEEAEEQRGPAPADPDLPADDEIHEA